MICSIVRWLSQVFHEPDENGGKPSFSRVFGSAVIILSLIMGYHNRPIPDFFATMFWVLVGYQLLSKALNSMSPAVLDIARSYMIKAGAKVEVKD